MNLVKLYEKAEILSDPVPFKEEIALYLQELTLVVLCIDPKYKQWLEEKFRELMRFRGLNDKKIAFFSSAGAAMGFSFGEIGSADAIRATIRVLRPSYIILITHLNCHAAEHLAVSPGRNISALRYAKRTLFGTTDHTPRGQAYVMDAPYGEDGPLTLHRVHPTLEIPEVEQLKSQFSSP